MRKLLAGTALAAGVAAFSFASHAAPAAFRLTSPEVAEGKMMATEQILNGFGCTGGNVSPDLKWTDPPANTKSFALTV